MSWGFCNPRAYSCYILMLFKIINNFIKSGLCYVIISNGFIVDIHHQDSNAKYGVCNVDCKNKKHYQSLHKCEKWKDKQEKFHTAAPSNIFVHDIELAYPITDINKKNSLTPFNLYSRPPPVLT